MSEADQLRFFPVSNEDTPKNAAVARILEQTAHITGAVLALASVAELMIGTIIADYLAESVEKRNLLLSVISGGHLNLAAKRTILMHLLKDKFPEIAAAYPDLESRLKKLAEFRNRCAHSLPDASDKYLAENYRDRIRLVWYEHGMRKNEDVTYAEAQIKIAAFAKTLIDVYDIEEKIRRFPPP
jgi:hypothetical protein